jgi:hypothetical protein
MSNGPLRNDQMRALFSATLVLAGTVGAALAMIGPSLGLVDDRLCGWKPPQFSFEKARPQK